MDFIDKNPIVLWYNVVTAITSTTGQLAIFYTIKRFGPIVFTIIMTTRQMVSIVVSNYMFNHKMSIQSYIGSTIVFIVIGYCLYVKMKEKKSGDNSGGNNNNRNHTSKKISTSSDNQSSIELTVHRHDDHKPLLSSCDDDDEESNQQAKDSR